MRDAHYGPRRRLRILVCDAQKKPLGVISLQDLSQAQSENEVGATVREVKEGAPLH